MIEGSHDCDLIFKGLFSPFFCVLHLLGKRLYCVVLLVSVFNCQIDRCEIPFPNFFYWFKELMEVSLVQFFAQHFPPKFNSPRLGA